MVSNRPIEDSIFFMSYWTGLILRYTAKERFFRLIVAEIHLFRDIKELPKFDPLWNLKKRVPKQCVQSSKQISWTKCRLFNNCISSINSFFEVEITSLFQVDYHVLSMRDNPYLSRLLFFIFVAVVMVGNNKWEGLSGFTFSNSLIW